MSNTITVKEWTDALRSGEYKQGTLRLRNYIPGQEDTFCCLGVLCDITNPNNWVYDEKDMTYLYVNSNQENEHVHTDNIKLPESLHVDTLVDMNDDGRSFKTIANHIEKYTEPTDVITF